MADRYGTGDGQRRVEVVTLSLTLDRHDGTWLRIRRWAFTRGTWPRWEAGLLHAAAGLEPSSEAGRRWIRAAARRARTRRCAWSAPAGCQPLSASAAGAGSS